MFRTERDGRDAKQQRDNYVHSFANNNNNNDRTRFVQIFTAYLITTMSKYDLKFNYSKNYYTTVKMYIGTCTSTVTL